MCVLINSEMEELLKGHIIPTKRHPEPTTQLVKHFSGTVRVGLQMMHILNNLRLMEIVELHSM